MHVLQVTMKMFCLCDPNQLLLCYTTSQYEILQCETTDKYIPHLQIRLVLLLCYITSHVTMILFCGMSMHYTILCGMSMNYVIILD
jgi:hypothetical protein